MDEESREYREKYEENRLKARYQVNKAQQLDGEYMSYYPDGSIAKEMHYKRGVINGLMKTAGLILLIAGQTFLKIQKLKLKKNLVRLLRKKNQVGQKLETLPLF